MQAITSSPLMTALPSSVTAETSDLLATRKIDEMKAMSITQDITKMLQYELEDMKPSEEISFVMSFTSPKLWSLIGNSLITISPEKMARAVAASLGIVNLTDSENVPVVVREIKRCYRNVVGKTIFPIFLRMKFTLCLMALGSFPRDLRTLVRLYDFHDLLGYIPPLMYSSPELVHHDA